MLVLFGNVNHTYRIWLLRASNSVVLSRKTGHTPLLWRPSLLKYNHISGPLQYRVMISSFNPWCAVSVCVHVYVCWRLFWYCRLATRRPMSDTNSFRATRTWLLKRWSLTTADMAWKTSKKVNMLMSIDWSVPPCTLWKQRSSLNGCIQMNTAVQWGQEMINCERARGWLYACICIAVGWVYGTHVLRMHLRGSPIDRLD